MNRTLAVLIAVAAAACRGSSSPSPTAPTGPPTGGSSASCAAAGLPGVNASGTMTAQVNGVSWTAVCIGVVTGLQNAIGVGATDAVSGTTSQVISFGSSRAVGTYNINSQSGLNANFTTVISGRPAVWTAAVTTGSGTLIVTSSTGNSIAGTFSFTMLPQELSVATGTKVVNGSFNITF